jgi:3-oxosteroid 1-dehydrogenase
MEMEFDGEYDVICAGAGIGGLSAAITAAEKGARVLVLEKFDKLGGVTALSSGHLWPGPNVVSEKLGVVDTNEQAQAYIDTLSQNLSVESLRTGYLPRSREAIKFFTETIGVELEVIRGLPDYYYPLIPGSAKEGRYLEIKPFPAKRLGEWADKVLTSPYGPNYSYVTGGEWVESQAGRGNIVECLTRHLEENERCAGAGLSASLVYATLKRNVDFKTSTAVTSLLIENGRVVGVMSQQFATGRSPEKTLRFRAKQGVVLATGGYDWRKDLMRSFDGLHDTGTMVLPSVTGDHFKLASQVGAIPVPARLAGQSPNLMGYRVPGEMIYGHPSSRLFLPGAPHSMIVNLSGRRFANDAFYPDVVLKATYNGGLRKGLPNWPAWLIFDQNKLDMYGLQPALPRQPLPEGLAVQADTLSALAEATAIDAAGLSETVKRFNGFCKNAVDPDFERGTVPWSAIMCGDFRLPNPNLADIAKAPFYAVKLQNISLGATTAGLQIDDDGRVLDVNQTPVQGLYATGNSAAWQDWGGGCNSGVAGMRGMLYGYRAAVQMGAASFKL